MSDRNNALRAISNILCFNNETVITSVGDFYITPLMFPVKIKISELLNDLSIDESQTWTKVDLDISSTHLESIIQAIACRINNSKDKVSEQMISKLHSCTASDLYLVVKAILKEESELNEVVSYYGLNKKGDQDERNAKFNPFAFIGNMMKYFRYDYQQLLWEIPFSALMLGNMSTPSHESGKDSDKADPIREELTGAQLFNRFKNK